MDEAAIEELVATHYARIVNVVALVAGDRATAEDAVQEAMARAWARSERRGLTIEVLPAWVTTCALNLARSGVRRRLAETRARRRAGPSATPALGVDGSAAAVDLRRALAELPIRQRETVVLHYVGGFEVDAIAKLMDVTPGTVKTQLHRGRTALAARLAPDPSFHATEVPDGRP